MSENIEKLKADGLDEAEIDENEDEESEFLVVFKKPYTFEGKEYTEIDLSGIEDMTGDQLIFAHRQFAKSKGVSLTPELDPGYAAIVGGIVTDKPIEFFRRLPAKELAKVKRVISGFFFSED